MYLIPYESAICQLSYTALYIYFLCIFLCGTPIFRKFGLFFHQNSSKISPIILIINSKIKLIKQFVMNT